MRRPAIASPPSASSCFPFLAVLICTMGALIVLLVLVVQQARVQADTDHRRSASAASSNRTRNRPGGRKSSRSIEWRQEILQQQREELTSSNWPTAGWR